MLGHSRARSALLAQLSGDCTELTVDVGINLLRSHSEAMLLLKANEHATEVVADEILKKLRNSVALGLAPFLEDLVSQVGAGLKSQTLRQAEGVVAVEKDVLGLHIVNCKHLDTAWHIIYSE